MRSIAGAAVFLHNFAMIYCICDSLFFSKSSLAFALLPSLSCLLSVTLSQIALYHSTFFCILHSDISHSSAPCLFPLSCSKAVLKLSKPFVIRTSLSLCSCIFRLLVLLSSDQVEEEKDDFAFHEVSFTFGQMKRANQLRLALTSFPISFFTELQL